MNDFMTDERISLLVGELLMKLSRPTMQLRRRFHLSKIFTNRVRMGRPLSQLLICRLQSRTIYPCLTLDPDRLIAALPRDWFNAPQLVTGNNAER